MSDVKDKGIFAGFICFDNDKSINPDINKETKSIYQVPDVQIDVNQISKDINITIKAINTEKSQSKLIDELLEMLGFKNVEIACSSLNPYTNSTYPANEQDKIIALKLELIKLLDIKTKFINYEKLKNETEVEFNKMMILRYGQK